MKLRKASTIMFSLVFTIIIFYLGFLIFLSWPITELSLSKAAILGNSFGLIDALFSGLAFAGLIITIYLQRQELKESRETFKAQKFEDAYYRLLEFYKTNLKEITIRDSDDNYTGIGGLSFLLRKLNETIAPYKKFASNDQDSDIYRYYVHNAVQKIIIPQSRYLGSLESLLYLVDSNISKNREREFYINIISSQLTVHEVRYIFYQTLGSSSQDNLVRLIHKLNLLDERITDANISKTVIKFYNELHGTSLPYHRKKTSPIFTKKEIKHIKERSKN